MIKTRFEIESTLASLKKFTGTKDEEKAKVEELNRKYGESFGYYDTIAQWYDILQKRVRNISGCFSSRPRCRAL